MRQVIYYTIYGLLKILMPEVTIKWLLTRTDIGLLIFMVTSMEGSLQIVYWTDHQSPYSTSGRDLPIYSTAG